MCLKVELELICEIVPVSSEDLVFSVDIPLFKITDHAGLEIKKNSKSPFGDYQRKKWSPNAKMQSPDSTRTETQSRAPFN